jgi:hypothetical protein
MTDTVETIYTDDKQRRARIVYDEDASASDPRDNAPLVEIVTPRHDMSEHTDGAHFERQHDELYERGLGGAFGRYLKIFHNIEACPVYKYEHGLVQLSTRDFGDKWDSGMIGWAYIHPDAETWEGMEPKEIIKSHLEELTRWMNGEVYGYIVERLVTGRKVFDDDTPDEVFEEWVDEEQEGMVSDGNGGWRTITTDNSCWGFIGLEWAIQAAKTEGLGMKDDDDV